MLDFTHLEYKLSLIFSIVIKFLRLCRWRISIYCSKCFSYSIIRVFNYVVDRIKANSRSEILEGIEIVVIPVYMAAISAIILSARDLPQIPTILTSCSANLIVSIMPSSALPNTLAVYSTSEYVCHVYALTYKVPRHGRCSLIWNEWERARLNVVYFLWGNIARDVVKRGCRRIRVSPGVWFPMYSE